MVDSLWGVDNAQYPLPGILVNPTSVLQLADPALYNLALFFSQVLNTNLLPRFSDEAIACGITHASFDNWIDGYAVAQTVVFPLNQVLLKPNSFRFPLLAIYPEKETSFNLTLVKVAKQRDIVVSWVLPPLTALQYNRLYPFLGVASSALQLYGSQGYDPKVNSLSVWETSKISFAFINGTEYKPYLGQIGEGTAAKQAVFPSIQMRLSFIERSQFIPANFNNFTSSYLELDLYDGYNPANPLANFIDGYIIPTIQITSCTPSSGSIQGLTLCHLIGTGFNQNNISSITICGAPVRSYQVLSSTQISVLTNPGITTGLGNIVLTDGAQVAYTLTNGFNYTSP